MKTPAVAFTLIGLFFSSAMAQAGLVTMEFEGVIENSGLALLPGGSAVSGSYTFDEAELDQSPGTPRLGSYDFLFGSVSIGAFNFTMTAGERDDLFGQSFASIVIDTGIFPTLVGEQYEVMGALTGDRVSGFSAANIRFGANSSPSYNDPFCFHAFCFPGPPKALQSDALLIDELPIALFQNSFIAIDFLQEVNGTTRGRLVTGELTRLGPRAATSVPLPNTPALLLLGLVLLGVRRDN